MKTWTKQETEILLENYNKVTNEQLVLLLPNKTFLAIYKKAYSLGLRKTKDIESQNRSNARKGEKSASWKGGRKRTNKGYISIMMPEHRRADANGYALEHIVVFENACGITIPDDCCIHHLNGIKDDNRIENLCMMQRKAHTVFHHKGS